MAEHPIFRTIIGGFIDGQAKALDRSEHAERMLRHQEAEAERRRIVDEAVTLAFDDDAVLPNPL